MNILIAVEELRVGGAQTFALRLAQALHEAGHRVYLYAMYWQLVEHELAQRLAPDVEVLTYQPAVLALDKLLQRADGWWQRRQYAVELRQPRLLGHLRKLLVDKKIEVVSSNTFKADHLMAQALAGLPQIPLVVTMHGDYEQFLAFYRRGGEHVIPGYLAKLRQALGRINGIAYLADQNLEVLEAEFVPEAVAQRIIKRRIYNGLDGRPSVEAARYTREALGLDPAALVFGMVARGQPEKGWLPVIDAYQRLRQELNQPLNLVLVGSSDYLTGLAAQYQTDSSIKFMGFVNNPIDCVQSWDVGLLPSGLKESLPNSIAEYLFCGKPAIATDVGEVANMLRTDEGQQAGLLVPFPANGLANSNLLYEAMRCYATEPGLLAQHQELALQAFAKFDMRRCVQAYEQLYHDCQQRVAASQVTDARPGRVSAA